MGSGPRVVRQPPAGGSVLTHSHLLPFSMTARRLRVSHNEHKANGETVRHFVRRYGLSDAFASRRELRTAIELNELWLLNTTPADSVRNELVASSRFAHLVTHRLDDAIDEVESNVAPPFPRHDDIVLECVRQGDVDEIWTMTWREHVGYRYSLKSPSLREVMRRGLEISAGNAEATLQAFERWTVAH